MKLVVLGSVTSVPHPLRTASAHWLQAAGGSVLLDISPDAAHRLAQEKLDWPNLDAIWISHFHLDHFGGLAPFLFGTKWAPQIQDRTRPLRIFGPAGTGRLIEIVDQSHHYRLLAQRFSVEVIEVEGNSEFEVLPNLLAKTFHTPHTKDSLAIRVTDCDGSSLVFTSDTGPTEDLGKFADGADLLLMECSYRRDKPLQNHLELREAMQIARLAEPKRVVLTHLYAEFDGVDLSAEAKRLWAGETIEARDGLRLEIPERGTRNPKLVLE